MFIIVALFVTICCMIREYNTTKKAIEKAEPFKKEFNKRMELWESEKRRLKEKAKEESQKYYS